LTEEADSLASFVEGQALGGASLEAEFGYALLSREGGKQSGKSFREISGDLGNIIPGDLIVN